jgi:uncharacterized protein (TIGR02270 family)
VCLNATTNADSSVRFWGAWSAVLLGDREHAFNVLARTAEGNGAFGRRAFTLALQAADHADAHRMLQHLAVESDRQRWLIEGSGIGGDPHYVPWLLKQMRSEKSARLAGAAFCLITGADFSALNLEGSPPKDFESEVNDDPDDPKVEMDPDDELPWPDVEKVEKWWAANASRFQAGTRYFVDAPVTRAHCIYVLKNGYQRQRILAAHYLCLLEPGTPLFNASAPAWRQQRLLAKMT